MLGFLFKETFILTKVLEKLYVLSLETLCIKNYYLDLI